jgi:ribosomal protein S18 acetylase RimI-like enzyme
MNIRLLRVQHTVAVERLIRLCGPYVSPRTASDYWLYAALFSSTCPIATHDDAEIMGAVIAFRSQNNPDDAYIQDVATHPDHRRQGIGQALVDTARQQAAAWGCRRLCLTSEPDNHAAQRTWRSLGFHQRPWRPRDQQRLCDFQLKGTRQTPRCLRTSR